MNAAAAVAPALRRPLERLTPALRRRLLLLLAAAAVLAAGYLLWLRDSSLMRVERVSVEGLTSEAAPRLRRALAAEARTMTTLHVDHDRLARAASADPSVRGLEVDADLPHALTIRVLEHRPVAILAAGGSRVPVSGDGGVLRGLPAGGRLPTVKLPGGVPTQRLAPGAALRAVQVAAAAPRALRVRLVEVAVRGSRGLVARVRRGPDLVFGDASRLRAKWIAAASVLAAPAARGASYLDLRLPERPAAGGMPERPAEPAGVPRDGSGPPPTGPAASPAPSQAGPAAPSVNPQP